MRGRRVRLAQQEERTLLGQAPAVCANCPDGWGSSGTKLAANAWRQNNTRISLGAAREERPLSVLTAHPDGRLPRARRRRRSPSRSQDTLEGPKRHRRARPGSQSVSAASSFAAYPDCGGIEIRWRSQQIYKHVQSLRVARAAAGLRSSARPPMATRSPSGFLHRHC
jgi:hypothetical protein